MRKAIFRMDFDATVNMKDFCGANDRTSCHIMRVCMCFHSPTENIYL